MIIAYKYNRYLVIVDGKTFANVADRELVEYLEMEYITIDEYIQK